MNVVYRNATALTVMVDLANPEARKRDAGAPVYRHEVPAGAELAVAEIYEPDLAWYVRDGILVKVGTRNW